MRNLETSGPGAASARLTFVRPADDVLEVRLAGGWEMEAHTPSAAAVGDELAAGARVRRLAFETAGLGSWDSALLAFLRQVFERCREAGVEVDRDTLPDGVRRLLELASAVPEVPARAAGGRVPFLARLGNGVLGGMRWLPDVLRFVGEVTLALGRFVVGRASYRRTDLWWTVQQAGVQALPIVGLLSFLIGMILAYVGAIQLRQFGAQIYVADLVGLAVAREMGAMMTGIVMAGRTGAAFAAQIGSMQANEEIDALRTLAISPTEFLVVPRMLALVLMMPLLCLYADLLGLAGGALIGVTAMDLGAVEYYQESLVALSLIDFGLGLVKGTVFGVMVAFAGCFHGMRSGRSSASVGAATTAAVVTGIVLIVVSDSLLTVLFDILGL